MNINKAMIVGRITQDLDLKAMPNGNSVLNFSVATNYSYKDASGQKIEQTEFHNIVSFGKQADTIAKYFIKGQEIFIEGRLQTRNWDDKETGKKMYRTEIIANQFEFGAKPGVNGQSSGDGSYNQPQQDQNSAPVAQKEVATNEIEYPTDDINPEDIPF